MDKQFQLQLYERMVLIREFEETVKFLFLEGTMPGTIHQCQGQEATAVGVCSALRADDYITSTFRGHGHALAKDIEQFAGVTLGPGALYGAITRLEERGLIEALPAEDRRRPYRITAAGSTALTAAVAEMRRLADVGAERLARSVTRRRRLA